MNIGDANDLRPHMVDAFNNVIIRLRPLPSEGCRVENTYAERSGLCEQLSARWAASFNWFGCKYCRFHLGPILLISALHGFFSDLRSRILASLRHAVLCATARSRNCCCCDFLYSAAQRARERLWPVRCLNTEFYKARSGRPTSTMRTPTLLPT